MSSESDKLRDLVDNVYPTTIAGLTTSIASLDSMISDLTAQKEAVEWGMTQAQNDQESRLSAKGFDLNFYGTDFGSLNLSDFWLYNLISVTGLAFISVDIFDVGGDQTSVFTGGLEVLCDCGTSGKKQRIVLSSAYNGPYPNPETTTVTLVEDIDNPLTAGLVDVYELHYEYLGTGWDSDANIVSNIDYFDKSWHHLNDPLGTDGTYGLNDKIDKIGAGKSIQEADKSEYETLVVLYDRFAT
jgi:hypothetical protein